jgi:putative membrane protein
MKRVACLGPYVVANAGDDATRARMLRAFLVGWAGLSLAFAITTALLDGMEVSGGVTSYLWVSLLFGLVNALLGTLLRILTLPLMVLTLGLFALVLNAFLLEVTDRLSDALTIDRFFWTAIVAALVLAVVGVILDLLLRPLTRSHEHA